MRYKRYRYNGRQQQPFTDEEFSVARQVLALGGPLVEAAGRVGCFARDLDLALWENLGRDHEPMFD